MKNMLSLGGTMRRKIKQKISRALSMALAVSMLMGAGAVLPVKAEEEGQTTYSTAGTMEIASRRVTKADLYDAVPEEQKTVSGANTVAVQNEVIKEDFNTADVVDYLRFIGEENPIGKEVAGTEKIEFRVNHNGIEAISDWSIMKHSVTVDKVKWR